MNSRGSEKLEVLKPLYPSEPGRVALVPALAN